MQIFERDESLDRGVSSGLLDQPSTRKRFWTSESRSEISLSLSLPLRSKAVQRINYINVLINQTCTPGKRDKDVPAISAMMSLGSGRLKRRRDEVTLVNVFILLSSIFRGEINAAVLDELKENRSYLKFAGSCDEIGTSNIWNIFPGTLPHVPIGFSETKDIMEDRKIYFYTFCLDQIKRNCELHIIQIG